MSAAGPWLVRLGKERSAGSYVSWLAGMAIDDQRMALRYWVRSVAERDARAFGGRVVRLRERAR
jgi:hypothetical protein